MDAIANTRTFCEWYSASSLAAELGIYLEKNSNT
ncbi:MAG: hypothetical protein KatS3mg031_0157 [Chitinophagales bacterium]|nr:MAG: hypothetical protein KatS3mg031_0157 [Chitinophagales bacterium]